MEIFSEQLSSTSSLIIILLGNFLCGILPFTLLRSCFKTNSDRCKRNRILTFITYFGGGAFMSICFLSLLPKANNEFELYHHHNHQFFNNQVTIEHSEDEDGHHHESFPIPELIVLCAFFVIFAIEELLVLIVLGSRKKESSGRRKVPFCSCAKRHTECSRTFKANDPTEQTLFGLDKQLNEPEKEVTQEYSAVSADTERRLLQSSIISQAVPNYGAVVNIAQLNGNEHAPILPQPLLLDEGGKVVIAQPPQNVIDYRSLITHLLLSITLATYSFLQGVSIGSLSYSMSWMHLFHYVYQFVLSFVIGSVISQDTDSILWIIFYVSLLSIMCPLGISCIIIFENTFASLPHLFQATFNAILCGSFLYLTFCELLRGSTLHNTSSLGKFINFTLGAAVIAGIEYLSLIT